MQNRLRTRSRLVVPAALASLFLLASACSSTPATTSSTGGATGSTAVPAHFRPLGFTATTSDDWWLLGIGECGAESTSCTAIVRTTNGGSSFERMGSVPAREPAVTGIVFASSTTGFLFGPELWETTDGGASWRAGDLGGSLDVDQVVVYSGYAYALACVSSGTGACSAEDLWLKPLAGTKWQKLATPSTLGLGASLGVNASGLYLLSGAAQAGGATAPALLYSGDRGTSFSRRAYPCSEGQNGTLSVAAGGADLWATCGSATGTSIESSSDGGATWQERASGFPAGARVAPASGTVALAWPAAAGSGGVTAGSIERTTDGGTTFTQSVAGASPTTTASWAGFYASGRAYAIFIDSASYPPPTASLYESSDSGGAWKQVAIRS